MESEFKCDLEGYLPKYDFKLQNTGLTTEEAQRIFQLTPTPPETQTLNDHIIHAVAEKDWKHFLFFLHGYESRLNRIVKKFRAQNFDYRYNPEHFLDLKLACVERMMEKLPEYDPSKGAEFTTFVFHDIRNAMLEICRRDESWSFKNLSHYKGVRCAAFLNNNFPNAREEFERLHNCSPDTSEKYIREARCLHMRQPLFYENDNGEESELRWPGRYWDFAKIIRDADLQMAVRAAFEKLHPRDQYFLEKRLSICMTCGHVKKEVDALTFVKLGAKYNITTEKGANKAYRKAVARLATQMVEDGALHGVKMKLKSSTKKNKKITTAVFAYQADCDGEWGEIYFDFEKDRQVILWLADWDTVKSNLYARRVIDFVLANGGEAFPKEEVICFDL